MKKLIKFNFAEFKVYSSATFNYSSDSHTHFFFNGCFYDQVDGVALGFPPLVPVLVNFFMGHYEKLWLNNYTYPKGLLTSPAFTTSRI